MALSSFDSLFASDEEKSVNGIPVVLGENAKGEPITVWVAETGNPNHEKAQRRYAKRLEGTRKNREAQREVVAKIIAESILVKWENFLDPQGNPIEPTLENKVKMLLAYKKFQGAVLEAASDSENFGLSDAAAEEETEKN